ncbi:MAG: DUF6057 family protein [Prevotella sp.]|jgi:hypothetical protein|nr:DUF6057 family protein [Prevotella sp.]MCH4242359.1 DUF6057 family protein [Prevotella sp.]
MIKILSKYQKIFLALLFGSIVFLFWAYVRDAYLSYQEQYQMFLFTGDYFCGRLSQPGGLALYLGECLTQFAYYPWIEAIILALVFILLQYLTALVARKEGAVEESYPLSFLPVIMLWALLGDENMLLTMPVALVLVMGAIVGCQSFVSRILRIVYVLLMIPVLYWLAGPVSYLFILFVCIHLLLHHASGKGIVYIVFLVLFCAVIPWLAGFLVNFPTSRLYIGLDYYRLHGDYPIGYFLVPPTFVAVPYLLLLIRKPRKKTLCNIVEILFVVAVSVPLLLHSYPGYTEDGMEYDRMVRHGQWNDILLKAEKNSPTDPFGVTSVNLALGMTGRLGDDMFHFYQNGPQGLLTNSNKDFLLPFPISEAYYQLGMINAAMRTTFEIQEAIPDYRKSARCMKRLAECNIIDGQYDVAKRYLRLLSHTLFYHGWAEQMIYCIDHHQVNSYGEFAKLRSFNYRHDFLFSDPEMDKMLGQLFMNNKQNRMAFEYMIGWTLLKRDLKSFVKFIPFIQFVDYTRVPTSYQEAFLYYWITTHHTLEGMPMQVDTEVARQILDFARIVQSEGPQAPDLQQFHGTYWYYLLVQHPQEDISVNKK